VGEIDGDYGRGAHPPLQHGALRVADLQAFASAVHRD
jgi:hypothetical protein